MNNLSTNETSNEVVIYDKKLIKTLQNTIYPGATEESIVMILQYCQATKLDPMLKPVHPVPMQVRNSKTQQYEWRDVVMPGIGLYRIQANRTGQHAGTSEPEFGPIITKKFEGKDISFPEWCKVVVYRKLKNNFIAEFIGKEYWLENYATAGKGREYPNAIWFKRSFGQIAKCAEAQALRKGFPELGSTPTAEEMEGKTFDEKEFEDIQKPLKGINGLMEKLGISKKTDVMNEPNDSESDERLGIISNIKVIDEKTVELVEAEPIEVYDSEIIKWQIKESQSLSELKEIAERVKNSDTLSEKEKNIIRELYKAKEKTLKESK